MLLRQDIPRFPHGGDVVGAAHGAVRVVEIFHVGGIASRVAPAGAGNVTFWLDVAVTAGFADKFRPRTNTDERGILAVQHTARLFHIHHQLRLTRDRCAKIRGGFHFPWRTAFNRQTRI